MMVRRLNPVQMSLVMPTDPPEESWQTLPDESSVVSPASIVEALASIDSHIVELLQQRAGWLARAARPSVDGSTQVMQQLSDLFAQVAAVRTKNGKPRALEAVFRDIDAVCRAQLAPVRVAFLGPLGTYTHDAALHRFGAAMEALPVDNFADIFASVESGEADYGVAPIENSTEGAVNQTHDLLTRTTLQICGEVRLRIRHCLMSKADNLADVRIVHAHPQSLAQCRVWLSTHVPHATLVSESSNAIAAGIAQQALSSSGVAAIAGAAAAARYELNLLSHNIEDITNNTTRFIIIGQYQPSPTGNDATSLLISAPHKPGGLRRMLQPFEDAGVSLTRIESRPARTQMWEYVFFIDVSGHCQDERLAKVLHQLKDETPLVRVLGSYPSSES